MADKPNRTPPPGVKAQKTALAIARWLALAVIIIAIIIAVTSCSSGAGEAPASDPPGGSSSAPASVSAPSGPAADAVAAGIERAASYNFTLTAVATAADLKALRAAPQDTLEGATVAPQSCRTAVRELNWSPASLGEDSARTDFAADGVDATGSVEVARVTDGTALKAHYATVKQMLGDCSDVTLSISGTEVPLRSTAPPAEVTSTATSALLWSRAGKGSDLRQQALVLIGERDGYVAMVSFIGTSGLENAKFSSMAGGILDATLDELA